MDKEKKIKPAAADTNEAEAANSEAAEAPEICSARIKEMEAQLAETIDSAQRVQPDFDNYRKRNASIRASSMEEGAELVIKNLLTTLDSFEMALACADSADAGFASGVELVYKQLSEALKKHGLSEIAADDDFDPNLHDAVMQDDSGERESGKITEVLQKGYMINNRVTRPTMVKVAK